MYEFSPMKRWFSTCLLIRGLEFHCRHGLLPLEHQLGAKFLVDAELTLSRSNVQKSELGKFLRVDLSQVAEEIKNEMMSEEHAELIEDLAARVSKRILSKWEPDLSRLCIRIHKPQAPIPGVFENVAIEYVWNSSKF